MPSHDTIAELFARNPFEHSSEDIESIIEYFRERRRDFKASGKARGPSLEKPKATLADLGL